MSKVFAIWAAFHCTAFRRRGDLPYGGVLGFFRRRQKVYCGLTPGHKGPHSWETA